MNGCGEEKNLLPLRGREIFLFQFFIRIALSSAPLVLPPQRSGVRFLGTSLSIHSYVLPSFSSGSTLSFFGNHFSCNMSTIFTGLSDNKCFDAFRNLPLP